VILSVLRALFFIVMDVTLVACRRISQEEKSVFWEVIVRICHSKYTCTCVLFRTMDVITRINMKMHSEEQHAMSSHELQSTLGVDGGNFENILCKLYQLCHLNNKYRY
jgi:hypothetical protein